MNSVLKLGALAAAAILAAPAAQATVAWSNPAGGNALFSYHDGYTNSGYFGDPVLIGNTFVFTPPAFSAISPGQNARSDTLQVDIVAQPGQFITGIIIREFGTRTSLTATSVQSTMFIKDLNDILFPQYQDSMVFANNTSVNPIEWSGVASRNGISLTNLQLSLTNNLSALFGANNITKTRVEVEILPTPGTFAAFTGAGFVLGSRRRRR